MIRNETYDKIIKDNFQNLKKVTKTSLTKFFINNNDIHSYVASLIDENIKTDAEAVSMIAYGIELKHCRTCGKLMSFKQSLNNDCCSAKCAANNPERNEKISKTNIDKYGVKNVFSSNEIKNKIKSTLLNKYGVDNVQKDKEIHQRTINTIKKFYKVNNSFNVKNVDNAFKMFDTWKDFVIPLFDKNDYINPQRKPFKWKCVKCGNEFEQALYSTNHLKNISQEIPRCWNCFPKNNSFSNKEVELREFCHSFFDKIQFNETNLLNGTELDIVIPEIKLALEFNGCYWHSIKMLHGNGYHLKKTIECNEKGFRLIHIWEDEWDSNTEYLKEALMKIFIGMESLNFTDNELILDRSWFNEIEISGYELAEILPPIIVNRFNNEVENCGYLKYVKCK